MIFKVQTQANTHIYIYIYIYYIYIYKCLLMLRFNNIMWRFFNTSIN